MAIKQSQVYQAFTRIFKEKGELNPVDRADVLSSLEIGRSIPPWLQAEVIEARNKLLQTILIQEFLHERDGKVIDVAGEYDALGTLRGKFPLTDKWADELRESRKRKE